MLSSAAADKHTLKEHDVAYDEKLLLTLEWYLEQLRGFQLVLTTAPVADGMSDAATTMLKCLSLMRLTRVGHKRKVADDTSMQ